MTRRQKKATRKTKSKKTAGSSSFSKFIWSSMVTVIGLVIVVFLIIWFVLPNVLPVDRSLIAVVSSQDPSYVLLVGLDEDPKRRQAVLIRLNPEQQQLLTGSNLAKINKGLHLIVSQLIIVEDDWPDVINSTVVADLLRSEISNRLPQVNQEVIQLLASWYLLHREAEFTQLDESQLAATELQKDWGSALTAGDDCQLAVLNSTDQSGLAGEMTQLIEDNGGVVIRLKQYPEQIGQTVIYLDENQASCADVVENIKSLFEQVPAIQPMTSVENTYRAPLVIILGNDYQSEIN